MYGTSYTKLQCAVSKTMIHSMQNCGTWYAKLQCILHRQTTNRTIENHNCIIVRVKKVNVCNCNYYKLCYAVVSSDYD